MSARNVDEILSRLPEYVQKIKFRASKDGGILCPLVYVFSNPDLDLERELWEALRREATTHPIAIALTKGYYGSATTSFSLVKRPKGWAFNGSKTMPTPIEAIGVRKGPAL